MPSPVLHVIDDDDAARDSLSFLISTAQIEVRSYETAPAFLAIVKTIVDGCVITDVRMPGMQACDREREPVLLEIRAITPCAAG